MSKMPSNDICPQCKNTRDNELSSFPVMPNESFTSDYNDKLGVEMEFKRRETLLYFSAIYFLFF